MLRQIGKFFQPKPASSEVAKNRLQLVIARERIGLPETQITELKNELYQVISRYFDIDPNSLEIEILHKNGRSALTVNTSVHNSHRG